MKEIRDRLLGTWRLVTWYNALADGTRIYPLGEEASGYISYSPDGHVFVHLSAAGRQPFASDDPFGGTPEEDSAAMKSFISYAGRYECFEDRVVHRVTQAACPNWVGTEQVRFHRFEGERLELSARGALMQGRTISAHVLWERC